MAVEDAEHCEGGGVDGVDVQLLLRGLVYLRYHGLVNRDPTVPVTVTASTAVTAQQGAAVTSVFSQRADSIERSNSSLSKTPVTPATAG